ncbi:MAG: hypothetical protein HYS12_00435 [Planctomycetes bacterium]|nr:hypothetical protein [Planctomycetota bacterium]
MTLAVQCPNCASKLTVLDAATGKRVKCPECDQPFTVPAATKPTETSTVNRPRTPAVARPSGKLLWIVLPLTGLVCMAAGVVVTVLVLKDGKEEKQTVRDKEATPRVAADAKLQDKPQPKQPDRKQPQQVPQQQAPQQQAPQQQAPQQQVPQQQAPQPPSQTGSQAEKDKQLFKPSEIEAGHKGYPDRLYWRSSVVVDKDNVLIQIEQGDKGTINAWITCKGGSSTVGLVDGKWHGSDWGKLCGRNGYLHCIGTKTYNTSAGQSTVWHIEAWKRD